MKTAATVADAQPAMPTQAASASDFRAVADGPTPLNCIAFADGQIVARGSEKQVLARLIDGGWLDERAMSRGQAAVVLVFDESTGEAVELSAWTPPSPAHPSPPAPGAAGAAADASRDPLEAGSPASPADSMPAESPPPPGRPGRPRLGVVAREVTLLPQDWAWLSAQPGGASVTLRKLVLRARRLHEQGDQRQAQLACYRFMSAIAGNAPGFEEATRALFTNQRERFLAHTLGWPNDVRDFARRLGQQAFNPPLPRDEAASAS